MKVGAAVDGLTAYIHERVKSSEVEETVSLEEQLREATSDLTAQLDEVKSELARRIAMAEEELIRVPGAKKKSKTQRQSNKIRELRATLKSREDDIYWLKERRETETSELRAQLEEEASERRTQLNEMKSELERKSEEICRLRRQYDEDTEVLRVLLESETSTLRAQLERTTSEIRALQDEMKPNPEHRERTHMRIVNRKLKDQLLEMESTIKRKEEDVEYTRNQYKLQLEYKRQEVTKLVARLERQMKITSELNAKLARQSPETE
jgi:DNA repair exonuclease SbcCD ATPase subunit